MESAQENAANPMAPDPRLATTASNPLEHITIHHTGPPMTNRLQGLKLFSGPTMLGHLFAPSSINYVADPKELELLEDEDLRSQSCHSNAPS